MASAPDDEMVGCGSAAAVPSIGFCARLLSAAGPLQLCQIIADEAAAATGATWCAVLRVAPGGRAFEVAGGIGPVPAALHDCHNMTPVELAGELGWDAGRPPVQYATGRTALLRALQRGGTVAAFALLSGRQTAQALAAVGWAPPATAPERALADLLAVTEIGAAALRQLDLVTDLQVSERTKSEFVATMSHELRNPLSAILGYTDLLTNGDFGALGEEQQDVLRRAHRSASSLLDLINATLDVSRFEVGDRADQTAPVDLAAVLREQSDEITAARSRDGVRIDVGVGAPLLLASDPLKVRVAVRQLIEAALAANAGEELWATARPLDRGGAIEIGPQSMDRTQRAAPVAVELPEDGEMTAVPFALFVARRLLEILGGSLALWRDEGTERIAFRLWIPDAES